jgi:hypothetical protein
MTGDMSGLTQFATLIIEGQPDRASSRVCHMHSSIPSIRASTCARVVETTHPPTPARMKAATAKKLILRIETSCALQVQLNRIFDIINHLHISAALALAM